MSPRAYGLLRHSLSPRALGLVRHQKVSSPDLPGVNYREEKDLSQAKVAVNVCRHNDGRRRVVTATAVVMATNVANVLSLFVRCGCPV